MSETLLLLRILSPYDNMVYSTTLQHVRNELCSNRCTRLVLLVLPCVWKMRENGCDPPGTRNFAGMAHNHRFHERTIGRCQI
jgi:hypothetical protein